MQWMLAQGCPWDLQKLRRAVEDFPEALHHLRDASRASEGKMELLDLLEAEEVRRNPTTSTTSTTSTHTEGP
jgi:hypothetical protein